MIPFLGPTDPFPPVDAALDEPDGLLAAGGGLDVPRLIDAYARGIFPWFSEGDPVLWWCPNPRMVLPTNAVHMSRSLERRLRAAISDHVRPGVHACAGGMRRATPR